MPILWETVEHLHLLISLPLLRRSCERVGVRVCSGPCSFPPPTPGYHLGYDMIHEPTRVEHCLCISADISPATVSRCNRYRGQITAGWLPLACMKRNVSSVSLMHSRLSKKMHTNIEYVISDSYLSWCGHILDGLVTKKTVL